MATHSASPSKATQAGRQKASLANAPWTPQGKGDKYGHRLNIGNSGDADGDWGEGMLRENKETDPENHTALLFNERPPLTQC